MGEIADSNATEKANSDKLLADALANNEKIRKEHDKLFTGV